jgi:uncharacterized protein (DUF2336 family)
MLTSSECNWTVEVLNFFSETGSHMGAILPADIVAGLESAVAAAPIERRMQMLWQVADLVVAGRDRLQDLQISVLDDVLVRLTERIEPGALAQLSAALAQLRTPPTQTLRRLASHENPAVATPVLSKSPAISRHDLESIAASRGEQHLFAISSRDKIDPLLTDILLKRGGRNIHRALARNPGAQLSEAGFATLTVKAEGDCEIAKALMLRPDLPAATLQALGAKLPQQVRDSALNSAPAALRAQIEKSNFVPRQASAAMPSPAADYAEAKPKIIALSRTGKLNDSTVNRFAIRGETTNLIASLSVLSGAPIEIIECVMAEADCEGLVMACRASRLNWQTTLAILNNRGTPALGQADRERAQQLFESQHLSTSQWTVRWGTPATGANSTSINSKLKKSGANR